METVHIGTRGPSRGFRGLFRSFSVADRFFSLGALAAVVGIGYYGLHLWMMLRGELAAYEGFSEMRRLHATLQFYLLVGSFLVGFSFQAAPKLLGGNVSASQRPVLLIPLLIVGVIGKALQPDVLLWSVMLALPFLALLAYLFLLMRTASGARNIPVALLFFTGHAALALSSFFDISVTQDAVRFFVAGVVPVLLAAGEQFQLQAGARKRLLESVVGWLATVILFLSSLYALLSPLAMAGESWSPVVQGVFLLTGLTLYFLACSSHKVVFSRAPEKLYLRCGFFFGLAWAFIGGLLLFVGGYTYLDATLHALSAGWALSLILAISPQILLSMSGHQLMKPNTIIALLLLWQVAVFDRALAIPLGLPGEASWVTASAATIVLLRWSWGVLKAESRILRAQYRGVSPHLLYK